DGSWWKSPARRRSRAAGPRWPHFARPARDPAAKPHAGRDVRHGIGRASRAAGLRARRPACTMIRTPLGPASTHPGPGAHSLPPDPVAPATPPGSQLLVDTFKGIGVGVLWLDDQARVRHANEVACDWLARPPAALQH